MKKLSGVIIFLFCAFISFAQSPSFPNTNLNNSNASTIFGYLGGLTSNGYKLKYFVDTTAANAAPYLKYTPHVMIKCGDNIYVRSLALDRWLLVGGASTITVPVLFNGVDSITTPSAGVLCAWTGGLSNCFTVTTTVVPNYGVDSVVLTGSQLCYFVGATPTCYTVANVINNTTNIVNYIDSSITQNNFNTYGVDSGSKLITGAVLIDSGFKGHTTTLYYKINGRYYTAAAVPLFTITTSSVSSDRYTQAYLDTLGNFGLIDCPYGNPVPICGVDDQSQLIVATYYIPMNSTTPQLVSNNDIYMEGVEWTMAGTARFNPLYTTLPFQGTYSLYDTAVTAGTYIDFTYTTPLNRSSFDYISMQLKLRAVFNNNTKLVFSFYLNNSLVTQNSVQLNNGSYGYNRQTINAYQAIGVPFSAFQFYSGIFNRVRISFVGANTSGLQIDNFRLQSGGLNTGGNLVTDVNGQVGSVNLAIGDTLLHNADTSRIQLKDRRTGAILGSIPSYLSYVRSRDTCFVIDTVGMAATKEMWFSINPNCRGGGSDSTTASNGLTKVVNDIQLGGTLLSNRIISGGVNSLTSTSSASSETFKVDNTGTGKGVLVTSVNEAVQGFSTDATSIAGISTNGVGLEGASTNNKAAQLSINPSSNNNVQSVMSLTRLTSGTAANGIGGSIDFINATTTTGGSLSNRLSSKWLLADGTSGLRSALSIQGIGSVGSVVQDIAVFDGAGNITIPNYGDGLITGTPAYNLAVTASGEIIEVATGSGGSGGISELGTSDSTLSIVNDSTYKANIAVLKTVWQARQDSLALVAAIATKQATLSGTGIVKSTAGTISYLTDPLPVANGGTGTATPSITAGTNITSVTGTWPNVTINAATQGGGSSLTRQVHTTGATVTVTGGNYILTIDPASTLAAVSVTMPASPSDKDIVKVRFGGTLTSGVVVTALTVVANTSQAIIDNTPPGTATADNTLEYEWYASKSVWFRTKL